MSKLSPFSLFVFCHGTGDLHVDLTVLRRRSWDIERRARDQVAED